MDPTIPTVVSEVFDQVTPEQFEQLLEYAAFIADGTRWITGFGMFAVLACVLHYAYKFLRVFI